MSSWRRRGATRTGCRAKRCELGGRRRGNSGIAREVTHDRHARKSQRHSLEQWMGCIETLFDGEILTRFDVPEDSFDWG